ncbi:MAG: hypothetical protein IAG13_15320, partial [Deltaproteobacteria bacterium]|nr:hypothetical protein [Nannocystaceae bacterium]
WWTLLGTLVAVLLAAVLLGYHKMLARLPAFTGERFVGWRDRRREVMELLDAIEAIRQSGSDRGEERWLRVTPDVALVLGRLGVPAFQIRSHDQIVVRSGDARDAWAWLGLPLPGDDGGELRLALAVRLPDLQQERLMLIERTVLAVGGGTAAARQGLTVVQGEAGRARAGAGTQVNGG